MSEFNFLTGRKELFDNAPPEAMVVLETNDGQIYFAVSHNRGARYWYDNGHEGRSIGLIALFEKTRVIASRVRTDGLKPVEPKCDPLPKSRLDRMEQAQKTLRKAVNQPMPVKPKPEVKPYAVKVESPVITPKVKPEPVKPAPAKPSAPKADGFVSIFAMSRTAATPGAFLNLHRNGNISLSTKLPMVTGDVVDVQVYPAHGLIRVGKVEAGGRALPKSRMLTSKALVDTFRIPDGNNSVRIYLTEADGWWQGQAELAGVAK